MLLTGTQAWSLAPRSQLNDNAKSYLNKYGQAEMDPVVRKAFDEWGNYQVIDAGKAVEPESIGPFGFGSLERDNAMQNKQKAFVERAKRILLEDPSYPFKDELQKMRVVAVEGLPHDGYYSGNTAYIPWDIFADIFERDENRDPSHSEDAEAIYELVDFLLRPTNVDGKFRPAFAQTAKSLSDARERLAREMELRDRVLMLETFGERLRTVRKARGLTQTELGRRVGVTVVHITRWERKAKKPRPREPLPQPKNVVLLRKALRFPMDLLCFKKSIGERGREPGCTPFKRLRERAYLKGVGTAEIALSRTLGEQGLKQRAQGLGEDGKLILTGVPTRILLPKEFKRRMQEIAQLPLSWRKKLPKMMELRLEQLGLTSDEFCASRDDVNKDTLQSYLKGQRYPWPHNIPGLSAAFALKSDQLIFAQSIREELSQDSDRGSRVEKAGFAAGLGQEGLRRIAGYASHSTINYLTLGKQKNLDAERWAQLVAGLRAKGLDVDIALLRDGVDSKARKPRDYSVTRSGEEVLMTYREHEEEGGIDPFLDMSFRIRSRLIRNGFGDNIRFITRDSPMGKRFLSFAAWLGERTGHGELLKHMKKLLRPDGMSPSHIKVIRGFMGNRVAGIPPNPLPRYKKETIVGHAGDRGIYAFVDRNCPEDRKNVETHLIHEFGARLGMTHAFNALLENVYAEWAKKKPDGVMIHHLLAQMAEPLASYPGRIKMRKVMPEAGLRERDLATVRAAGVTVDAEWEEVYERKAQAAANLAKALENYSSPSEVLPGDIRFEKTTHRKAAALDRAAYAAWSYWDDRRLLVQPRADEPWSFDVLKVGDDRVYRLGTLSPAHPGEKPNFVRFNFVKEPNPDATIMDVPALIGTLGGSRDAERYVAIRALGMMGSLEDPGRRNGPVRAMDGYAGATDRVSASP